MKEMENFSNRIIIIFFITELFSMVTCRILTAGTFVPVDNTIIEIISNTVNEVNNIPERIPDKPIIESENGVINEPYQQPFDDAVREMKGTLRGDDEVCSLYDPPTPNFMVKGRRISEAKCLEHIWRIKRDEETLNRVVQCKAKYPEFSSIVGGRETEPGEFPHMGAIGWKSKKGEWAFLCGGFLISDKFLLSAAHCQTAEGDHVEHKRPVIVRFGVKNIIKDEERTPVDVKILKFMRHPKYKPAPNKINDIAIVELAKRVSFDKYIQPACILNQYTKMANVTGWGVIDSVLYSQNRSDALKVAEVDLVPSNNCTRKLQKKEYKVAKTQICATRKNSDACGGDSGGPLQTKLSVGTDKDVHNVIGIVSFGFICGVDRHPTVYTKVSSYLNWIEGIVWSGHHRPRYLENDDPEDVKVYNVQQYSQGHLLMLNRSGSRWSYLSNDVMK